MTDLASLTATVERIEQVDQSAVTLIQGLAEQIRQCGTDQTALNALADRLNSSADSLAAAITANTPAAPTS